jgi:hypothetical protein
MAIRTAWKLSVANRSLMLIIPLCVFALVSAIWNVRQYQFAERQRLRAIMVAQRAKVEAARVDAEAERGRLDRQAASARANARVDQLYQEINNLTRVSEQILLRDTPAK